jgi:hypothetical protein
VIKPGEDLMEIVPIEDTLLVEAQVKSDIAFIHVGQQATVKFDTYDFSIYGGLKATVEVHQYRCDRGPECRQEGALLPGSPADRQELSGVEAALPIGPATRDGRNPDRQEDRSGLPDEAHPQGPRRRAAGALWSPPWARSGRSGIGHEYQ